MPGETILRGTPRRHGVPFETPRARTPSSIKRETNWHGHRRKDVETLLSGRTDTYTALKADTTARAKKK